MLHEPADEVHVAAQAIELGDDDRRFGFPGSLQGPGQLRPVIVAVLAALHLDERLGERAAFGLGEPPEGFLLGLKAETRPALLAGGHSDVADRLPHWLLPKRADERCCVTASIATRQYGLVSRK